MIFNLLNIAYAEVTPVMAANSKFDFKGLIPIALFFVVMYLFLVRPQQKKFKQQTDLLASLRRGDRVIVAGGIMGSIHKIVGSEEIIVEIAENIRIKVLRSSVSQVLAKTEPVSINSITDNFEDDNQGLDNISDAVKSTIAEPLNKAKKIVKMNTNSVSKSSDARQTRDINGKLKKTKEKL